MWTRCARWYPDRSDPRRTGPCKLRPKVPRRRHNGHKRTNPSRYSLVVQYLHRSSPQGIGHCTRRWTAQWWRQKYPGGMRFAWLSRTPRGKSSLHCRDHRMWRRCARWCPDRIDPRRTGPCKLTRAQLNYQMCHTHKEGSCLTICSSRCYLPHKLDPRIHYSQYTQERCLMQAPHCLQKSSSLALHYCLRKSSLHPQVFQISQSPCHLPHHRSNHRLHHHHQPFDRYSFLQFPLHHHEPIRDNLSIGKYYHYQNRHFHR